MSSGLPTQKFMVNRDKMRDANMPRDQASQHWETIRDAIFKIYNHKASSLSYEELYRTAYSLVLHKHGEMLYNNVKATTVELLQPIAQKILNTHDDEFLKVLNKVWADEKLCIIMIKDILLYMNKNYVPKLKLQTVEHMQTSCFKKEVVLNSMIKTRLIHRLIEQIRSERDGNVIDKTQVRSAIQLFIEVGMQNRKIYEQEFESVLLTETTDYFKLESNSLISDYSTAAYLSKAHKRLLEEFERVASYLSPTTETKLIDTFLKEYIGEQHAMALLTKPASGLIHMIKNQKTAELTLLYTMFSKRQPSFELLRKHLADFIMDEGNRLIQDEKLKNEDFVTKLIELREQVVDIYHKAMKKDNQIDLTIKLAFEKIVNQNNRTAKALVFYLDEMFKKEFKTIVEADLNDQLDRVIHIFRYLLDKDVFESFYKNSFAKRLLEQRRISDDAEKALVLKLKEECGFQFTQKLEVMFKDMKMSEELSHEFKQRPSYHALTVDLTVKVLTAGHWPNDQKDPQQQLVHLPKEISASMTGFTQFYFTKFNQGRQLHWKLSLGSAEIRGYFSNKSKYEFSTSTYQMFMLMLFNEYEKITYQQMLQITQIQAHEMQLHLIPLIKSKILQKSPAQASFSAEDELRVNKDYKSNLYKNKIAVMVSKQAKEQENSKVESKVEDDRRYTIDSQVIKVMKARKRIEYVNLMSETTKFLAQKFSPDPSVVKVRIESLIERGYIKRDENDKRIFTYVA